MTETLITDQRSQSSTYKILRRLGKGGTAEVFLARQEGIAGLRRLTVIKRLLPQFSEVNEVAEMLLDEARIAAQLTHPNIVQIYELAKDRSQYFIAMEYVDGCDLATLARIERQLQSRVPLRLSLRIISEAAMGLDYAHRQTGLDGRPLNIVHRDVSPHNIMCSREGAVKVTDFGIAKAVGKLGITEVGVVKGKVQYMSPEQYTGAPLDHRSDIFSLGVVLYQLTTGKLPRVAKDGGISMKRVTDGRIPRPSELVEDYPEELEAIVMRALAHHPDDRYPDAASFREDLLDFARQNDLLAFPKELGDYVNELVPPVALVVREQSMISTATPPPYLEGSGPKARGGANLPLVIVEGEDADTDAPRGTEVVPAAEQRRYAPAEEEDEVGRYDDEQSGRYDEEEDNEGLDDDTAVPTNAALPLRDTDSQSALTAEERLTPLGTPTPLDIASTDTDVDRPVRSPGRHRVHSGTARTRLRQVPRAVSHGGTTTRTSSLNLSSWLGGGAVLVALACAAALVYLLVLPRTPPPVASGPGAGMVVVRADPAENASISIDGAQRCASSPCKISGLPLNRELLLTIRKKGYALWMQRVVLTAREPELSIKAHLDPRPAAGLVRLDAAAVKSPLPGSGPTVAPPHHPTTEASAVRPKHHGQAEAAGAKSQGEVVVSDVQTDAALLAANVQPWAEVWIDGSKVGHTPLQIPLKPGSHLIELKNSALKYHKRFRRRMKAGTKTKIVEAILPPAGAGGQ